MLREFKRKIDAYLFAIDDDESVDLGDQIVYYGGITFMLALALTTGIAVY